MALTRRSIRELLLNGTIKLKEAGYANPSLDARLLLQHLTGLSHAQLISQDKALTGQKTAEEFDRGIQSRLAGKSIHRIIGHREFFGHSFMISDHTLEPRPDTEILMERIISEFPDREAPLAFADVGTGTGAIAIALLKHFANAKAYAIDISGEALEIASHNASACGVNERFRPVKSDYLENFNTKIDFLVSNPPYIRSSEISSLPPVVRDFDPVISLDGGSDGLIAFRSILEGTKKLSDRPKRIFFEVGFDQAQDVTKLAGSFGWQVIDLTKDLQGNIRVVTIGYVRK